MSEEISNVEANRGENSSHDQTATSTTEPETYSSKNTIEVETVSCFVLPKDQVLRRWLIRLIRWPENETPGQENAEGTFWFERISMFVIMANCITLAMYDPFDNKCRTSKCKALEVLEKCVFTFFFLEMVIKMIAMGVVGKKGYLQDKWNRLDFLIVLVGVIETAMLGNDSVLTIIRAFRVLRPLRAINRVPSIRILVTLLLDTLPMLGNVLMLSFLMFFVFGIVGVQLWQGQLRNRCFMNSTFLATYSQNFSSYYRSSFQKPDYICSLPSQNGMLTCSSIPPYYENNEQCTRTPAHEQSVGDGTAVTNVTDCVDWGSLYTECRADGPNPFHQAVSFDNIGISWIVIFQVITLEGWSDIMYFVQDSHNFWDWIYFVILIVSGSFFLVNLCLVVITMQFQETKQRETEMMEENRRRAGLRHMRKERRGLCCLWKPLLDCFRKNRFVNEHIHYHHHHVYHHHLHHHLYNCFVPLTPDIFSSVHLDEDKLPAENLQIPEINVQSPEQDKELLNIVNPSSHSLPSPTLEERLGSDSKNPLCSHDVSIHAETSSSLSVNLSPALQSPLVTEAKSNVSLAFTPSPHKVRSNSINSVCSNGSVVTSVASEATFSMTSAFSCQECETNCQECENLSRTSSLRKHHQTHSHSTCHVYEQNCYASPSRGNSRQNSERRKQSQGVNDKFSCKGSALPNTLDVYSLTNTLHPGVSSNWGCHDSKNGSQTPSRTTTPICHPAKTVGALDVLALKEALDLVKKDERSLRKGTAVKITTPLEEEETINAGTNVKEHHTRNGVSDNARRDDESLYADSVFDLRQSDFYSVAEEIDVCQKLRNWCRRVTESTFFMHFVMAVIMANMICMSLEHYQQPEQLTKALDITNVLFVIIFTVEMAMKLLGLGFTLYLSQCQNVFDGFIVFVSVLEILIQNGSGISLSIFRSIRLLRIFKLVRPVRYQLLVMVHTMTSVITFFALLFLFMFAFAILGMNLFGGKFRFPGEDGKIVNERSNFDNFLWAMITVFQILTQENWNVLMYNGMRSVGMWSATYFIALMTIGYYVLFNLLVAILVEGFTGSESHRGLKEETSKISENLNEGMLKTMNPVACDCYLSRLAVSDLTANESKIPCSGNKYNQSADYCVRGVRNALGSTFKMKTTFNPMYSQGGESMSLETVVPNYPRETVDCPLTMPELKRMRQTNISIVRRTRNNNKDASFGSLNCGFSSLNEERETTLTRSMTVPDCKSLGLAMETKYNPAYEPDDEGTTKTLALRSTSEAVLDRNLKLNTNPSTFEQSCQPQEQIISNCSTVDSSSGVSHKEEQQQRDNKEMTTGINSVLQERSTSCKRSYFQSPRESTKKHLKRKSSGRQDWSLFIFSPRNRFRKYLGIICRNKWFDYTVLFFILLSCIVLAMEEPSDTPTSKLKRQLIDTSMFVFTIIFTVEMMMKVIASGLVLGPNTYLRDGWNVLDGLLVLVSWLDVIVTHTPLDAPDIVGTLRVFRAFRTLRPLRVIRRAPGLKLVVETLLYSLKPIGNTVLIAAIFFLIFGILGVQLFKGMFYYCEGDDHVADKIECNNSTRGRWVNQLYNFDNLPQALVSLFVFSTKDGWIEIMLHGIDAVGVDKQPVVNHAEWRLLYFIPFLLLGGFLVLNMIVGVVVENFQRARQRQVKEDGAKKRKQGKNKAKLIGRKEEDENYFGNYSPVRRKIHSVCTHPYWDVSIAVVICINVICMSLEHYQMSKFFVVFVETTNYFFTAVFVIEVTMRLIAVGYNCYLKDRWNLVDLLIVALSVAGIFLQEINSQDFKVNPSIIRALRVLRIIRVLKLVKLARGVRSLLDTILEALPQVGNLGLLFLLLFFIYSCLGIQLFGSLECSHSYPCQGMGPHAHFRDFGTAMLTLFRIATGDNWNGILKDTLRTQCNSSTLCTKNCCVSKYSAPLFFITFVLVAQFVLVNVVIAVLMKHLKESKEKIAANIAARNIETKLRLVTLAARRFIQTRARRTSQAIARRRSAVEIGLSGIELAQLKSHTNGIDKSFCTDLRRSDGLFQEFLQLKSSLRKAKMRASRTTSHNITESSENVIHDHEHLKKRRNTVAAIHTTPKRKADLCGR